MFNISVILAIYDISVILAIYDIFCNTGNLAPVNIQIVLMLQNVAQWLVCVWNSGWYADCYSSSIIVSVHNGFSTSRNVAVSIPDGVIGIFH